MTTVFAGVCFDLYSTLAHEDPANPFYRDVAAALDLDLERWLPAYRRRGRDSMQGLIPGMADRVWLGAADAGQDRPLPLVQQAVDKCFPSFVDSVTLDPQALPLLAELRGQGVGLALVSNASSYSEEILDLLDLRRCFDALVMSYAVGALKPEPVIYQHALDRLGLPGAQCAFVGDGGDRELVGASALGMFTVLVDRDLPHTEQARAHARVVVAELGQVSQAIQHTGS